MKFKFDPTYLDVLAKKEYDNAVFLGRHHLAVLSADGWVRALRKKCETPRRAFEWGFSIRTRLMRIYDAQTKAQS